MEEIQERKVNEVLSSFNSKNYVVKRGDLAIYVRHLKSRKS